MNCAIAHQKAVLLNTHNTQVLKDSPGYTEANVQELPENAEKKEIAGDNGDN